MKHTLYYLTLFLTVSLGYGQTTNSGAAPYDYTAELARNITIPSSPETAAFMKYGDIPLNHYTGTLPNAMVSTYTYDPLIGITSMTDPKGYTMYYTYDDLNRLKTIKDQQGNILSENEYHYKNN